MMRCLVIDDEALALDLLEDNIRKVSFLELVAKCRSGFEAFEILQKEKIDLIFLDIQMPDISGIQFLKSLPVKPLVIFTTAYEKYALEGFEMDVVDYLLKPFSFDRFLKSVNKAQEYLGLQKKAEASEIESPPKVPEYLFVKSDYKLIKIDTKDILYIEGLKDYIKIYLGDKPVITLLSMKAIEEKLPSVDFFRIHRSFIVNLHKIKFIQRNTVIIGDKVIPIGENYKDPFLKVINYNKNT
jgi:DNA-binding LytR/AlgR family response regulator